MNKLTIKRQILNFFQNERNVVALPNICISVLQGLLLKTEFLLSKVDFCDNSVAKNLVKPYF